MTALNFSNGVLGSVTWVRIRNNSWIFPSLLLPDFILEIKDSFDFYHFDGKKKTKLEPNVAAASAVVTKSLAQGTKKKIKNTKLIINVIFLLFAGFWCYANSARSYLGSKGTCTVPFVFKLFRYAICNIIKGWPISSPKWDSGLPFEDGAYYCYCAYVLRIPRYSGFPWVMLTFTNTGIFKIVQFKTMQRRQNSASALRIQKLWNWRYDHAFFRNH